jgi:hypothetical protein
MSFRTLAALPAASILAILGAAPAALAQVTPAEVWENWKALMGASGDATITAIEEPAGDTLTVRDLRVVVVQPDITMTMDFGTHVFEGQADGSVTVALPERYTILMEGEGPDMTLAMSLRQTNAAMVVTGSGDTLDNALTADEMRVVLDSMRVDGQDIEIALDVALANLAGNYRTVGTDVMDIVSQVTASQATINASGTPPEPGAGPFKVEAVVDTVSASTSGLFGAEMFVNPDNLAEAFAMGFRVASEFSHGPARFRVETDDPMQGQVTVSGEAASGALSLRMDGEGLSYGGSNTGLKLEVAAAAMPLPDLSATIAETGFNLTMPLQQSDTPQDFGLLVKLRDVAPSNTIWNMADPGSILPREPATLELDLAGKANWLVDILDPATAEAAMGGAPGEVHSLEIRSLEVAAGGARLTGSGAFTFDNADTTSFDGMPRPEGAVDFRLTGGNGLIQRLAQMGLLPPDQVLGAQMILGLFARPTGEPDVVTSRIEVDATGQLVANGQALPLP